LRFETRQPKSQCVPRRCILAVALGASLATACSSESLPPPEPEVQHAGSFVAVGDRELSLYRTLKALRIEGDTVLFTTLYDVAPGSFDQAREIAKQASLPVLSPLKVISRAEIVAHRHQVVWFRTLTKAEEDRSP
jgi:hypothetical protein